MLRGVDVSNHQGQIGWPSVAADGIRFAWIKATEGTDYTDAFLPDNWAGARANGLARGAYHYARVNNTPASDAEHFLETVRAVGLEPGDLLALDLEEGPGDLSGWALTWLAHVEAAVGFRPFLYSYPHFMATHGLNNNPALALYPLWYAWYGAVNQPKPDDAMPIPPSGWPGIVVWQDTSNGNVAGIHSVVDLDWFNGDNLDALRAYGKPDADQWNVGAGVRAAMQRAGDTPTSDESYLVNGLSYTSGRDGLYFYTAANDQVYRAPKG